MAGFSMRASPPAVKRAPSGPAFTDLSTPAKERIALASRPLFMAFGIHTSLRDIAELAESNEATAVKYYECQGNLVQKYVLDLMDENEILWTKTAAEHPNDPEAHLRSWIEEIELRCGDAFDAVCLLPRAAAQLFRYDGPPLL